MVVAGVDGATSSESCRLDGLEELDIIAVGVGAPVHRSQRQRVEKFVAPVPSRVVDVPELAQVLPQYDRLSAVDGQQFDGVVQHHQNDQTVLALRHDVVAKYDFEFVHALFAVNTHYFGTHVKR